MFFPDIQIALEKFIKDESLQYYDNQAESIIDKTVTGEIDTEDLIRQWEKAFKEETSEYAIRTGPSDEDIFATAYHRYSFFLQIFINARKYLKLIFFNFSYLILVLIIYSDRYSFKGIVH